MRTINKKLKKVVLLSMVVILSAITGFDASANSIQLLQTERFNMTYIYFGNTAAYVDYVDNTKGSLDHIAPSYFDINKDGTLKLNSSIDKEFINAMHDRGIKVTPFLSNHWDRESGINALVNADKLSSQIADAILKYSLDGVNVDIENVTEMERDKYTELVRLLRQKLPSSKSVSVAVAANPYKISVGWHGSYDFATLQEYSDYLMIMAYDQHYQGYVNKTGGAGPVAGYSFVEESIKAALNEVPSNKLVLGIPFYGRLWKQDTDYGGYGISNNKVEALLNEFSGKVFYDHKQKSPKAVITIGSSDRKPVIYGQTLEEGTYDIWFENEASIKSKLELVTKYNLLGTGSWSLGQEAISTWDYYSLWLNGRYFSDIQNHWAKASILAAMDRGWMNGVSSAKFMPDSPMTRAQAAALLVRALDISVMEPNVDGLVFYDVTGHWAQKEIEAAAKAGIMQGVGSGRFEPDAVLTREQMTVILDRLMLDESVGSLDRIVDENALAMPLVFIDVDPVTSTWSYEAIGRMADKGFIEGFPDGSFRPKEAIRRGQVAVLMIRVYPDIVKFTR